MKKGPLHGKRDYTPVSWDQYFERAVDVKVDANVSFLSVYFKVFQHCCIASLLYLLQVVTMILQLETHSIECNCYYSISIESSAC